MTEILEFEIVETVGNFIQDNVNDIVTPNRKRWVFPTFPEKNAALPQATIEVSDIGYENDSAGDFLYSTQLLNGDYREYYYKKAEGTMHIYVITKKDSSFEVDYDQGKRYLTNKPLNIYLTHNIRNTLFKNRGELLKKFLDFHITDVSPTFENDQFTWASDITCRVNAREVWVREYANGELISDYSLGINVII